MKPFPHRHIHSLSQPAFSLVETVLALGILGLAITALLGLLPHGIEMTRRAANISAVSRITSSISSELSLIYFGSLRSIGRTRLLYDDQGSKNLSAEFISYVAEVTVVTAGAQLPGDATPQQRIVPVQIRVAATPNRDFDFERAPANSYQTIPVLLGPSIQQ
jgi:uncharacterized protein (TIGR02598 family)